MDTGLMKFTKPRRNIHYAKKIIALFSFFILIFSISFSAYAASPTQQIEYLSDGSYIVTEIVSEPSDYSLFSTTQTKSKTSTYYNAANEKIFHMATEHLLVSLLLAPPLYIVILGPLAIKKLVNLVTLLKQVLLVSVILTDTLFNLLQEQLP